MQRTITHANLREGCILWHYTVRDLFERIQADGLIKCATARVPLYERPIVWFSTNQVYERTAIKGVEIPGCPPRDATWEEMLSLGLVRIGVRPETAPYNWGALQVKSRMSNRLALGLVRVAKEVGAKPSEWRGTFEPVPRELWVAVERYENGIWIPGTAPIEALALN